MRAIRIGLCGFTISMGSYRRDFPVVEVQSTFYDPPRDETMRKWRAVTGADLEYTMKVWQLVTHPATSPTYRRMKSKLDLDEAPGFFRNTSGVRRGWERSLECAGVLSATAMLFQCPASFKPASENVQSMQRFFSRIKRPNARLLWEPRGAEWTARQDLAHALCEELDLVHVIDPFVTTPKKGASVYWRLHGPGNAYASYDQDALERLHRTLLDVSPTRTAYVLFNNLPRLGDARRFTAITGQLRQTHVP